MFYSFEKVFIIIVVFQVEEMLTFSEIILTLVWLASLPDIYCLRRHSRAFLQ